MNSDALDVAGSWAGGESIRTAQRQGSVSRDGKFDVERWLVGHQLPVRRTGPWKGGRKWELEVCPFNPDHDGGSAVITETGDGRLGFRCQHNSCRDRNWRDLRERLDGVPSQGDRDGHQSRRRDVPRPKVFSVSELQDLEMPLPQMRIQDVLPLAGAAIIAGPPKSGKTIASAQIGMQIAAAVHTPHISVFDHYRILKPGPVLLVEHDDPGGVASVKQILTKTRIPIAGCPFYLVSEDLRLGPRFVEWLQDEIEKRELQLVILDSYTSLRGPRAARVDLVKAEADDMKLLDQIGKRMGCTLLIIHHYSKGSAGLDWSDRGAGTFAMTAAVEAFISITRFPELDVHSPERLVRIRGRHFAGAEMVLRFDEKTLGYEHVLSGGAAAFYGHLRHLQEAFGNGSFAPKALWQEMGMSRASANRLLLKLMTAGVLKRVGYGEYALRAGV